jgi:hypothetical protein
MEECQHTWTRERRMSQGSHSFNSYSFHHHIFRSLPNTYFVLFLCDPPYLFNSSALFFKSALLSGVGRLSACTGPYLALALISHLALTPSRAHTGFALCAFACAAPPEVASLASLLSCSSCVEALLSDDSLATLSVMPISISNASTM